MKCEFVPGQQVVCIDDLFNETYVRVGLILPKLNEVYTIRDIVIEDYVDETVPALYFKEIRNPVTFFQGDTRIAHEMPFAYWRFRPLTEGEQKAQKSTAAPYDFNKWLDDIPPDLIEEVKREKVEEPV